MRCPGGMLCSVVLILEACEDSLLDRPKYVPGRGAPRIMWAVHGVVSHVHSGARAIELKECHSVFSLHQGGVMVKLHTLSSCFLLSPA